MTDTKAIHLSSGGIALVDAEDYELVAPYHWYFSVKYAKRDGKRIEGRRPRIYMHRVILEHHGLLPDGMEVDHMNRNGLDNRKENLRPCTHAQNMQNHHGRGDCDGFKGLRRVKDGYYAVRITANNHGISLGGYRDEYFAAQVYNVAARHFFGEFAYLNEIPLEKQLSLPDLLDGMNHKATRAYALVMAAFANFGGVTHA